MPALMKGEAAEMEPARAGSASSPRPRVLFVGASRYALPLPRSLARKWEALERQLDLSVIARAGDVTAPDPRFRLVDVRPPIPAGAGFYARLPALVAAEIRRRRPQAIMAQGPFEAFCCLPVLRGRDAPKLIVEYHGDWGTASRLYGSPRRRYLGWFADRAAVFALRRADATKALSPLSAGVLEEVTGRPPVATFLAYIDLESFRETPPLPLPERPMLAWIGGLTRYKDPATLEAAWRIVAERVPEAGLVIVGEGIERAPVERLARDFPDRVSHRSGLASHEVAELLDRSTALMMSSRSEGVPRVIMEAFARARPVVAPAVGGIGDIVTPGETGLLVAPGDPGALADALVRVLTDRDLATRMGEAGHRQVEGEGWSAEGFARSVRGVVDSVLAEAG